MQKVIRVDGSQGFFIFALSWLGCFGIISVKNFSHAAGGIKFILPEKNRVDMQNNIKQGKTIKILFCCILTLLFMANSAPAAFANSAEPPGLTVIVTFPPDDLTLSLRFADGSVTNAVKLQKEQKAWEAYYRLFNGMFDTSLLHYM